MSTVTKALVAPALGVRFDEALANQINRSCPLLQTLMVRPAYGQNISWTARFGSAVGAATADGADVTTFNNDTKLPAVLQFGVYTDAFKITGLARAVARAAGNPAQLADLFMDEFSDCVQRLAKGIAQDVYTGTGGASPQSIHGLRGASVAAVGSTGVYAGIDRAVQTQWQASVLDATTLDASGSFLKQLTAYNNIELGIVAMRQLRRMIGVASGEKPDLIVTTPTICESLGLAMHKERRWIQDVRLNSGIVKLDPGYMALEFDGVPVIEDINAPTGVLLMLNTAYVQLLQPADDADGVNGAMGMAQVAGSASGLYGDGRSALRCRVQPLAKLGDSLPVELVCYLQMRVKSPNTCGAITGLT